MRSSISARTARAAPVLVLVIALTAAQALAAQAATVSSWPVTVARHYGGSHDAAGYSAVVASGRSGAWALGGTNPGGASTPVALRWTGGHWRSWPLPHGLTGFIGDASAPSGRDIWAVSYSRSYVLHWNGTRWSVAERWRRHDVLTGVTALSADDVWVFGTTTNGVRGMGTWHFDGRSWTRVQGRANQISRASAVSRRDIWAVAATRRGGFIEHYDGWSWRRAGTGGLGRASLDDVLALSRDSVWVVGNLLTRRGEGRLVLAHFNGQRWTRTLTPWNADTGRLAPDGSGGIWITADNTGARTDALIGHLSSGCPPAWTTVQHGLGSGISDIAASPATRRVWLSGGFLTRAGGEAAIWSHLPGRPSPAADGRAVRLSAPLDFRSWRLDLAALLQVNRDFSLLQARRVPPATRQRGQAGPLAAPARTA